MDNTSLVERLYGFLKEYDLIQADLNEEEITGVLEGTLDNLNENEEVLTCFVASHNGEANHVYAITSGSRIIGNGIDQPMTEIDVSKITKIENGVEEESSRLFITTEEEKHALHALSENGVDNINDALYSAMNELLPAETVDQIFGEELAEPEEILEESESVITPEEEVTSEVVEEEPVAVGEVPIEELETATLEESEIPETTEPLTTEVPAEVISDDELATEGLDNFSTKSNFDADSFSSGGEAAVKEPGKKTNINKPLLYILGAVGVILIAYAIYSAVSYFMEQSTANSTAETLIDYFNQVDEIYDTATGYNKDPNAVKTEQWKELDTKARDLETKINDTESSDLTRNLADAVYYYDEALITALIYGQNFAASKNPYDQNRLTKNLQQANLNRSAALGFINQDFPKLADKVNNNEDTAGSSTGDTEMDEKIEEAESHPSEGAQNRENSGNSQ